MHLKLKYGVLGFENILKAQPLNDYYLSNLEKPNKVDHDLKRFNLMGPAL